jgi:hypothetical protein
MKLTTILLVPTLALATAPAQEAAFYRVVSTNETRITACDPPNALLTWTSAWPNACCNVQRAGVLSGPWSSDFPHTVVANTGSEGTVLVPLGASALPDPFDCGAALARMTNSIRIGTNSYRIETYLWRNMFPGPGPPTGLLAAVRLVETNGFSIPGSITIPRFRVINSAAVWNVYAPPRTPPTPPYVLAVTGRNGPYWAPGTRVNVLLEVANGNVRYLLKATDQVIDAIW